MAIPEPVPVVKPAAQFKNEAELNRKIAELERRVEKLESTETASEVVLKIERRPRQAEPKAGLTSRAFAKFRTIFFLALVGARHTVVHGQMER
jgi:hypothetical protein